MLLINDAENRTIIAKSQIIKEKLDIIERASQTDSSVLLFGESGVGKDVFAERIHFLSPRREKPFVRVNCAAIPKGHLESELFGSAKKASNGAALPRYGRFELANGGTIFLDEIDRLPLTFQERLLTVIQEQAFEKAPSGGKVPVDVRILAATNKNLEKKVETGEFRGDLFYRINVLPLYIPPLRQRQEDIPELADFFLKKSMKETKTVFDGFSEEAMKAMLSYSWPGNIRELENYIERACVAAKGSRIEAGDLFIKPVQLLNEDDSRNLKTAENKFRTEFIKRVLEEYNWNQTEAAKALNIQRTYLSRLIKELEINNPKE